MRSSKVHVIPSFLVALGLVVLPATRASADPSKEDVAKADVLFRDAQLLVQKGQLSEGCAKFAESQRLDPANGTLLNLALCHDKEGRFGTAYKELQDLIALLSNSKNPDDRERARVANERLRLVEKKVTRVTLDISELPKDATITVNAEKVTDPAYPMPLDPGSHVAEASAPRKKTARTPFEVKDPGPMTVKLEALVDDGPVPPAVPPEKPAPPPPASGFWTGQRILGAAVAGVGLIGIGVGAGFGLDTFAKRDLRNGYCKGTVCNATGIRLHNEAGTSATISSIAFIGGGIALAVGTFLFVTGGKKTPVTPPAEGLASRMTVGIGPTGMSVAGAF